MKVVKESSFQVALRDLENRVALEQELSLCEAIAHADKVALASGKAELLECNLKNYETQTSTLRIFDEEESAFDVFYRKRITILLLLATKLHQLKQRLLR